MKKLFYLVVAIQLLFLLGEVGISQRALSRGRMVTLKCAPVDPRSLFMGNYMILGYEISTIDLERYAAPTTGIAEFRPGRTVYVGLVPAEPYATLQDVDVRMPAESSVPHLRGRILSRDGSLIQVEYGLERYYIPEAKQDDVARIQWNTDRLSVQVAIEPDGTGIIKRVLLDGKPIRY